MCIGILVHSPAPIANKPAVKIEFELSLSQFFSKLPISAMCSTTYGVKRYLVCLQLIFRLNEIKVVFFILVNIYKGATGLIIFVRSIRMVKVLLTFPKGCYRRR